MKRFVPLLLAVLLLITACTVTAPVPNQPAGWQVLKVGSITRAPADLPQEGVHLFQSLGDWQDWAQRYGVEVSSDDIDFSKNTVVVFIRPWRGFQPVVKRVDLSDGQPQKAVVVLSEDRSKPLPQPGLPAGMEVRQLVVLKLSKVSEVTLHEE